MDIGFDEWKEMPELERKQVASSDPARYLKRTTTKDTSTIGERKADGEGVGEGESSLSKNEEMLFEDRRREQLELLRKSLV